MDPGCAIVAQDGHQHKAEATHLFQRATEARLFPDDYNDGRSRPAQPAPAAPVPVVLACWSPLMPRWLIAILIVGALLVGTNPGREEFNDFVPAYVSKTIEAEARKGGESHPAATGQVAGAIAGVFVQALPIERRNYLAFSIFEVALPDVDRGGKCRFIGVAGQFLPLGDCKLH